MSEPIALATSLTSAPVASHKALIEFIELILCAKKALAVSFANSLLHIFVLRILFFGTQLEYILNNELIALSFSPPIRTLSDIEDH